MAVSWKDRYQSRTQTQALGHVIEECGELLAALGKTLRWGPDSVNPEVAPKALEHLTQLEARAQGHGAPPITGEQYRSLRTAVGLAHPGEKNRDWVAREVRDLDAALEALQTIGLPGDQRTTPPAADLGALMDEVGFLPVHGHPKPETSFSAALGRIFRTTPREAYDAAMELARCHELLDQFDHGRDDALPVRLGRFVVASRNDLAKAREAARRQATRVQEAADGFASLCRLMADVVGLDAPRPVMPAAAIRPEDWGSLESCLRRYIERNRAALEAERKVAGEARAQLEERKAAWPFVAGMRRLERLLESSSLLAVSRRPGPDGVVDAVQDLIAAQAAQPKMTLDGLTDAVGSAHGTGKCYATSRVPEKIVIPCVKCGKPAMTIDPNATWHYDCTNPVPPSDERRGPEELAAYACSYRFPTTDLPCSLVLGHAEDHKVMLLGGGTGHGARVERCETVFKFLKPPMRCDKPAGHAGGCEAIFAAGSEPDYDEERWRAALVSWNPPEVGCDYRVTVSADGGTLSAGIGSGRVMQCRLRQGHPHKGLGCVLVEVATPEAPPVEMESIVGKEVRIMSDCKRGETVGTPTPPASAAEPPTLRERCETLIAGWRASALRHERDQISTAHAADQLADILADDNMGMSEKQPPDPATKGE